MRSVGEVVSLLLAVAPDLSRLGELARSAAPGSMSVSVHMRCGGGPCECDAFVYLYDRCPEVFWAIGVSGGEAFCDPVLMVFAGRARGAARLPLPGGEHTLRAGTSITRFNSLEVGSRLGMLSEHYVVLGEAEYEKGGRTRTATVRLALVCRTYCEVCYGEPCDVKMWDGGDPSEAVSALSKTPFDPRAMIARYMERLGAENYAVTRAIGPDDPFRDAEALRALIGSWGSLRPVVAKAWRAAAVIGSFMKAAP